VTSSVERVRGLAEALANALVSARTPAVAATIAATRTIALRPDHLTIDTPLSLGTSVGVGAVPRPVCCSGEA
jgi:Tfp pilus assembly protein FimT